MRSCAEENPGELFVEHHPNSALHRQLHSLTQGAAMKNEVKVC